MEIPEFAYGTADRKSCDITGAGFGDLSTRPEVGMALIHHPLQCVETKYLLTGSS